MTHSLHRRGIRESLEGDYVLFLCYDRMGQDLKRRGSPDVIKRYAPKTRTALEICARHNPVGISTTDGESGKSIRYMKNWHNGNTIEDVLNTSDTSLCNAIFTSKEDLNAALLELKEADLGISVVVSGIFDDVFKSCNRMGVGPHTVNMSIGTLGKTDLMPETSILEIVTMCGHSYISPYLVEHLIKRVKEDRISAKQAAVEMGVQCTCNFFNVDRAAKLIKKLTS
jgi:hypothetical protein